jgi:polysaccharide pyruvyl transferase WcaK-like protein
MKKVALIGAWGYGNVGDDAYPTVWRRYLPDVEFEIYNSDWPTNPPEADLYLFGGGGIIYDNDTAHLVYMKRYVDWAAASATPVMFASVGIQARRYQEEWQVGEALERWSDLLSQAVSITVRDPTTQALLEAEGLKSDYYPDLCYLTHGLESPTEHFITVIPGVGCSVEADDFRERLDYKISEMPGAPLVIIALGAPDGDSMVDELSSAYSVMAAFKSKYTTVGMALSVIRSSRFVFTGRYHGMVFARAARKSIWRPDTSLSFKMMVEDLSAPMSAAIGHVEKVAAALGVSPVVSIPNNLL